MLSNFSHFLSILVSFVGGQKNSGVNKSARERIGRQNLSQKVLSKKGSLGVIFSPRKYRENTHSKSANFEGRHSGGHLLGRPLLFTSKKHIKKKHLNTTFTGLSRNFVGGFRLCVFFSPPKKNINNLLAPTQSRENPANLFLFMCFSFSLI